MKFTPKVLMLSMLLTTYQSWASPTDTDLSSVASDNSADTVALAGSVSSEQQFFECAAVISDAERLACFDNIAQGQNPSVLTDKRPLDLGKTVASTFKGDPQLVLASSRQGSDDTSNTSQDLADNGFGGVEGSRYSPLSLAYDLDKNSGGLWRARPHNPMYVLPVFVNTKPNRAVSTPTQKLVKYTDNELRSTELKMQLSFKSKIAEDLFGSHADLWFGYTQQAHWQVYNEDNSRPFRALDYQPELFVTQPVVADLPFNGKLRMLGAGVMHHSNGERDPWSRSWNRAYLMGGMEWGNLTVMPRIWARVAKGTDGTKQDDNPDITDYYSYGDVRFLYQLQEGNNISGVVRLNPSTGKGALQLDYVRPIGKGVSGYVQLFHGYGQSIIDYNHETTAVGVGIMLNDWMGL